mgnify:CR=1 FL=1|jgi:hypothetical protein
MNTYHRGGFRTPQPKSPFARNTFGRKVRVKGLTRKQLSVIANSY